MSFDGDTSSWTGDVKIIWLALGSFALGAGDA